jgi:hypothetical protein
MTTLKYMEKGKNYEAVNFLHIKVKESLYRPGQALRVPNLRNPEFKTNRHKKIVRL